MTTEIIKPIPGILSLMKGSAISHLPFTREITLLETRVAGTYYQDFKMLESINEGDRVSLFRESSNEYDCFAVSVYTSGKLKVGYIPKGQNEIIARLLDAGKSIGCVVTNKEVEKMWVKIGIRVVLVD